MFGKCGLQLAFACTVLMDQDPAVLSYRFGFVLDWLMIDCNMGFLIGKVLLA